MTPTEAQDVVTLLLAAFPRDLRPEQVEDTSRIYRAMMRDLDFDRTKIAIRNLIATAKRLPLVAEIREALLEVAVGGKRSGAEAWRDVLKAVSRFGVHREPTFDDPLVADAVTSVGWRAICNADETDPAPRAKFADAYNALAARTRRVAQIAPGAGAPPAQQLEGPRAIAELVSGIVAKVTA